MKAKLYKIDTIINKTSYELEVEDLNFLYRDTTDGKIKKISLPYTLRIQKFIEEYDITDIHQYININPDLFIDIFNKKYNTKI